jgi:nitrite reductase (NADH) small subunit
MMTAALMDEHWITIGRIDDIPPLGARTVRTASGDIAVFRTADDAVFALADRCPHLGGPLSQGIVADGGVYCPLHNWCIDLKTGCAREPDDGRTERYPIQIRDGVVLLRAEPEPA